MAWCSRSWTDLVMYRELGFRHPINLDPLNLKGFVSGQPPYSDLDEDESPTFAMKFCPVPGYEDHLCLGNEEGVLKIYDTKDHLVKYVTPLLTLRLHSNALMDLAYAPRNHRQLVSVSGDSTAVLWDLENKEKVKTFKGHKKSVKVAEWSRSDDNVFVTASRDNSIQMWDLRCHNGSKPENAIRNAHSVYSKNSRKKDKNPVRSDCSVTSVKFLEDNVIVSCGDHDGYVKVWDWRRNYSLYKGDPVPKTIFSLPKDDPSFAKGFTSMAVDYVGESSKSLFVNCMNDRIYKFDLVSCDTEPCTALKTISNSSFYTKIALSPDGTYLASGAGGDGSCFIWNVSSGSVPESPLDPIALLVVSDEDEVTCADWCKSGFKLATVSDETPLYIWGRQDGFNPKSKQINATVEARILVDTYSNDSDNYEPTKNKRRVNFLPRSCAFGNSYHAIKAESSFEETQNLTLTPKRGKKFAENKNRSSPKTPLTPSIKNYFNRI